MNEEIKEILAYILSFTYGNESAIKGANKVLNYIINLQEENQEIKEQLNCKEYFSSTMPENTEFVILTKNNYDRQQKDLALKNIELKQENQKLNKIIDELEKWLKEGCDLTCGCGITNEYIYAYENALDKLIELKKEVSNNE